MAYEGLLKLIIKEKNYRGRPSLKSVQQLINDQEFDS